MKTITVYVNWDRQEILSEAEYDRRRNEFTNDLLNEGDVFADFCEEEGITPFDLLNASEVEKSDICQKFADYCDNVTVEQFDEDWDDWTFE